MRSGVLLRWMKVGHRERRLFLSFDPASAFKTEIAKYSNMGTVPILVVPMTDERDTPRGLGRQLHHNGISGRNLP